MAGGGVVHGMGVCVQQRQPLKRASYWNVFLFNIAFIYQLGADSVKKMEGIIPFEGGVKTREYKNAIKS